MHAKLLKETFARVSSFGGEEINGVLTIYTTETATRSTIILACTCPVCKRGVLLAMLTTLQDYANRTEQNFDEALAMTRSISPSVH